MTFSENAYKPGLESEAGNEESVRAMVSVFETINLRLGPLKRKKEPDVRDIAILVDDIENAYAAALSSEDAKNKPGVKDKIKKLMLIYSIGWQQRSSLLYDDLVNRLKFPKFKDLEK